MTKVGDSMHDKLEILLNKIGIEQEFYQYFKEGKLEKLILSKDQKKSCFIIQLQKTLPLDVFISLKEKLIKCFTNDSIETVLVKIKVNSINYALMEEYYKYIIIYLMNVFLAIKLISFVFSFYKQCC